VLPTGYVLVLVWRRLLARSAEQQAFAWLPVTLWVSLRLPARQDEGQGVRLPGSQW
jgi:hypothetical protein